jgi:hypothetical protein
LQRKSFEENKNQPTLEQLTLREKGLCVALLSLIFPAKLAQNAANRSFGEKNGKRFGMKSNTALTNVAA